MNMLILTVLSTSSVKCEGYNQNAVMKIHRIMWSNTANFSAKLHVYVKEGGSVQYSGISYCDFEDKLLLFM